MEGRWWANIENEQQRNIGWWGGPIRGGYPRICSDTGGLSNTSSLWRMGSCKQRPSSHQRDRRWHTVAYLVAGYHGPTFVLVWLSWKGMWYIAFSACWLRRSSESESAAGILMVSSSSICGYWITPTICWSSKQSCSTSSNGWKSGKMYSIKWWSMKPCTLQAGLIGSKTEWLGVSSGEDLHTPCPTWDSHGRGLLNNGQVMVCNISAQGHLLQDRGYIAWSPLV